MQQELGQHTHDAHNNGRLGSCDDVAHSAERGHQSVEFRADHELNQPGQHQHVKHLANELVEALSEVGQGQAGVREHLAVLVLQEVGEDGQHLLHCLFAGVWILVSAQVGQGPCDVPQKCDWYD